MRRFFASLCVLLLVSTAVLASDFAPTLMKLTADPIIQYDFDGSLLEIPVEVSGHPAGLIFCVYTKDEAEKIPNLRNGYLGWHHVNKVDTCIYMSSMKSFQTGAHTVEWDGKNNDGAVVDAGEYTYYMWAFDNFGAKTKVCHDAEIQGNYRWLSFQEVDTEGLPLANPIFYRENFRWSIGNDPLDATLKETANLPRAAGWASGWTANPLIDPTDFNYFYTKTENKDANLSAVEKWKWVPGGDCELQTDFGEEGYAVKVDNIPSEEPGVVTDGTYMYTVEQNYRSSTEPDGEFYIFDFDGFLVDVVDLTEWWARPDEFEIGTHMNSGPNAISARNGNVFLNCHCSCIKQMVNPMRYLESGDTEDFYVWSNMNGDYVLDNQFEATAKNPWACNYPVVGYTYTIHADDNLFTQCSAYDYGAVSFGLMGPDGYGIGFFAFSGETAGWKKGSSFIDSGTAFDGMYCDNEQAGGTHYEGWKANDFTDGLWWIGHDSISGVITDAVDVADVTPAAFSVDQNSPNPFNPTTTISFSLVESGTVTVEVYNVAGQRIETLADGYMNAGQHSIVWNASGYSAGVYFYTVTSGQHSKTMKMTLIK